MANQERYEQMLALLKRGVKPEGIARRLGVTVRTIQNWKKRGTCPGGTQRRKQIVRKREGHLLSHWKQQVADSGLPEIQRFAKGLERDKEAVLAGLTERYSNGMTEGFVNKLKLIKRQGYWRANFPRLAPTDAARTVEFYPADERTRET